MNAVMVGRFYRNNLTQKMWVSCDTNDLRYVHELRKGEVVMVVTPTAPGRNFLLALGEHGYGWIVPNYLVEAA